MKSDQRPEGVSNLKVKLGPFSINSPFILAPMAGITNSPFRRLMREEGSGVVISELVSANGLEYGGEKTRELLEFDETERPVGLQIFGESKELLVKAALYIEKLGADFVDLNLGCPVPKVVKKGAGAALCRQPRELGEILEAMVKAVKIPVTIKIRTGWDESSKNANEVVHVAAESGVAWVAVHGRTRAQGYSGEADWNFIGEIKSKSSLPIIGNGDVISAAGALRRLNDSGVDAVMIGRGALKNPFLFRQCRELWLGVEGRQFRPEPADYIELMRRQRHYLEDWLDRRRWTERREATVEDQKSRSVLLHARKFLAWYSAGFPGCHEFRRKLFSEGVPPEGGDGTTGADELWTLAEEFFQKNSRHRDPRELESPFLMGGHG